VPREELDIGARTDVEGLLKKLGAISVKTRRETWGDESNRRTDLCVAFSKENVEIPFAAYALTRVAPLLTFVESSELTWKPETDESSATVEDFVEEIPLPPLETPLASGNGGMGNRWLDDHFYWAVQERNSWRKVNRPFKNLETALFGNHGAKALFEGQGAMIQRITKYGQPIVVVIRIGATALLATKEKIAVVEWERVPAGDAAKIMKLFEESKKIDMSKNSWEESDENGS